MTSFFSPHPNLKWADFQSVPGKGSERSPLGTVFGQEDATYLWARTVSCPYCGGLVPMSPNWRLSSKGVGVRLLPQAAEGQPRCCQFEIVQELLEQSEGTVKGGDGKCPFPDCGRIIEGDEIKRQAQAGQMGEQLYAVVYREKVVVGYTAGGKEKVKLVRGFRPPRPEDDVSDMVRQALAERMPEWQARGIVPDEEFPENTNDDRPRQYGMPLWRDLLSPRQLLGHCVSVEVFHELVSECGGPGHVSELDSAALTYVALAMDKLLTYNCRSSRWHPGREVLAQIFERHDFSVKWTFAEMAPVITGLGYDWAIEQTGKALAELIELSGNATRPERPRRAGKEAPALPLEHGQPGPDVSVTITCQSGDSLGHVADGSVDVVVMDPPYYDNVMYAELSDFFYVWLKRTAGLLFPEQFASYLTDKDREAVANPAKFKDFSRVKGSGGAKKRAARGLDALIRRGGKMQLLVGCTLGPKEIEQIEKGYDVREAVARAHINKLATVNDQWARDRIGWVAWAVAHGHLDVKLAVPLDKDGKMRAGLGLYHAKMGVLVDEGGNKLVFKGSINETPQGWLNNCESFDVNCSWEGGKDLERVDRSQAEFDKLWSGKAKSALVVDFPEAMRQKLLEYLPKDDTFVKPPISDDGEGAEEAGKEEPPVSGPTDLERMRRVWAFIATAARRPDGAMVAVATSAVEPWPHQLRTYKRMLDNWPFRLLIADEVGLGKTIEAGLLIRHVWISGLARRILILTPAGILRQWQAELYEKFNLLVPIYTGSALVWPEHHFPLAPLKQEVDREEWTRQPLVLVSSQLMRRRERQAELLEGPEWDLLVLDEAHHARRSGGRGPSRRRAPTDSCG